MQSRRGIIFIGVALALALGAAYAAQRWMEGQRLPAVSASVQTKPVAVVRQDTSVGSVINPRELGTVDWPMDFVPQGAYANPEQLAGRVLRRPLASGEPVLESSLLPVGSQGGLVSVIDPSRRAMSVKVDPVVGVAGFVVPGSRVDVLVTIRRNDTSRGATVSKVILQDVRVLAIDQKLEEAKEGDPQLVQVVTLELSPQEAEKLTHAAHEGKLQLALRNPTDREIVKTHSIGVAEVLGDPRRTRIARAAPGTKVEVIKGSNLSVENF